jgi:predicted ribosome quality control (RQC) complex YloA/Tae2 family protein
MENIMVQIYKFELSKTGFSEIMTADFDESDEFVSRLNNTSDIVVCIAPNCQLYISSSYRDLDVYRKGMLEMFSFMTKTGEYSKTYNDLCKEYLENGETFEVKSEEIKKIL